MVLAREPEHGDDGAAGLLRELPGELDGGDGFVDRVERAAEEPELLPRHDDGALGIAQRLDARADRLVEITPGLVLLGQHVGERRAVAVECGGRARGLGPRRRVAEVVREEAERGLVALGVATEEIGKAIEPVEGDAAGDEGRSGTIHGRAKKVGAQRAAPLRRIGQAREHAIGSVLLLHLLDLVAELGGTLVVLGLDGLVELRLHPLDG